MRQLKKDFSETKDFVASSAAALVSEAVYKSNQPNKSTQVFRKSGKICKPLIFQENLKLPPTPTALSAKSPIKTALGSRPDNTPKSPAIKTATACL
jgi:membrane carboxypeptidase/penicillin-binding protein